MSQATLLVAEDDDALREALCDTLEMAGHRVLAVGDGHSALNVLKTQDPVVHLLISDVHMPGMDGHSLLREVKRLFPDLPVILITAYGTIEKAVEAIRGGALDYLVKPFEAEVLVHMVDRHLPALETASEVVTVDPAMRDLMVLARRVAASDATVLIGGASGTGKEVLARYLHAQSSRAMKPFVAINCAAIPDNMLEATLFGYEKGAFTGAYKASPGKFELAQGGTLLLDEISEMDQGLQAKILRVLQEREVERLGGSKLIQLDVRVLATSNRNIAEEVVAGRFREDLYYRINVFPLVLPALHQRPADIIPLAEYLLARAAQAAGRPVPKLTPAARERLGAYHWPGNVRELDNVVQRALILQSGTSIAADDLHFEAMPAPVAMPLAGPVVVRVPEERATPPQGPECLNDDLRMREWNLIIDALTQERGSRKDTATRLGISQRTLRYKLSRMREAGVRIPGDVGPQHA